MVSLFETNAPTDRTAGYATLSYCWGGVPQFSATRANIGELINGFSLNRLSQTVKDAVEVTRSLGLRYLWVDALCIVQDDPLDKDHEIERMGSIYMSAAVTIAALSATATTEGFLRIPRQSPRSCDIPFPLGYPNKLGTISLVGQRARNRSQQRAAVPSWVGLPGTISIPTNSPLFKGPVALVLPGEWTEDRERHNVKIPRNHQEYTIPIGQGGEHGGSRSGALD